MPDRTPLTVAVAQPELRAHDVAGNARQHARIVAGAGARVVVFPELSLTGYELDAEPVAVDDERLEPIQAACQARDSVALVGAPITEVAGDHIAMVAIDAAGPKVVYRKMNLGDVEAQRFAEGPSPEVLEIDGWRLGLAICKDTGVVEHGDATAALGIDAYLAGIVDQAVDRPDIEERAKRVATDHKIWVCTASHAGPTGGGFLDTAGASGIWRPDGSCAVRLGVRSGDFASMVLT